MPHHSSSLWVSTGFVELCTSILFHGLVSIPAPIVFSKLVSPGARYFKVKDYATTSDAMLPKQPNLGGSLLLQSGVHILEF